MAEQAYGSSGLARCLGRDELILRRDSLAWFRFRNITPNNDSEAISLPDRLPGDPSSPDDRFHGPQHLKCVITEDASLCRGVFLRGLCVRPDLLCLLLGPLRKPKVWLHCLGGGRLSRSRVCKTSALLEPCISCCFLEIQEIVACSLFSTILLSETLNVGSCFSGFMYEFRTCTINGSGSLSALGSSIHKSV